LYHRVTMQKTNPWSQNPPVWRIAAWVKNDIHTTIVSEEQIRMYTNHTNTHQVVNRELTLKESFDFLEDFAVRESSVWNSRYCDNDYA